MINRLSQHILYCVEILRSVSVNGKNEEHIYKKIIIFSEIKKKT